MRILLGVVSEENLQAGLGTTIQASVAPVYQRRFMALTDEG